MKHTLLLTAVLLTGCNGDKVVMKTHDDSIAREFAQQCQEINELPRFQAYHTISYNAYDKFLIICHIQKEKHIDDYNK